MEQEIRKCLYCNEPIENLHYLYFHPDKKCKEKYKSLPVSTRKKNWEVSGMSFNNKYRVFHKPEEASNIDPEHPIKQVAQQPIYPLEGYVYLLMAENGICKIGLTHQDIKRRVEQIERDVPLKMEVLHYFYTKNCRKAEIHLHTKYAEQRIKYEWFKLSEEQIKRIMEIADESLDEELGL
jgi:predicted GIY-YIG superfamily endonuclease